MSIGLAGWRANGEELFLSDENSPADENPLKTSYRQVGHPEATSWRLAGAGEGASSPQDTDMTSHKLHRSTGDPHAELDYHTLAQVEIFTATLPPRFSLHPRGFGCNSIIRVPRTDTYLKVRDGVG